MYCCTRVGGCVSGSSPPSFSPLVVLLRCGSLTARVLRYAQFFASMDTGAAEEKFAPTGAAAYC